MRTHAWIWWLATICFFSYTVVVLAQEQPRLDTLDQLTRLQIPVTTGSTFRMLTGKGGELTLVVDRVTASALQPLSALNDTRVQKISVKPLGLDKAEVLVQFQDPGTESFAYQQGNTLVVDLWKGASAVKAAAPAPAAELPKMVKAPAKPAPKASVARSPAAAAPKLEHKAAPKVALVEPLRIERDLFQKFYFPMPELVYEPKDKGLDLPLKAEVESRWTFAKGNKEDDDGKGFEFAKKLYESKKFGLCLKTIEIVLRDQPQTKHADELLFLRALAYRKLGEATQAEVLVTRSAKMMEELAARRDEHGEVLPFQRLIVLGFAQKELAAKNWLAAIQYLENVSANTSAKNPDFPYVQYLLAEAYGKVNQPRRAERLYRFIAERFPKHLLAKESSYRIADLLAFGKNYQRVTEEAQAALRDYPEFEKTRPEVLFHMGEAYFWLGDYKRAEKSFKRYTEVASAQTNSSLGWVRLGEIEEILRSDTKAAREK